MNANAQKPLWAKCPTCQHCWPVLYYPIALAKLPRMLKQAVCPKGCDAGPVLAKQHDGELQEQGS